MVCILRLGFLWLTKMLVEDSVMGKSTLFFHRWHTQFLILTVMKKEHYALDIKYSAPSDRLTGTTFETVGLQHAQASFPPTSCTCSLNGRFHRFVCSTKHII